MKNKILRLYGVGSDNNDYKMEISCFDTNEIEPYREIKECGIVIIGNDLQVNFSIDEEELSEIIDFSSEMENYISIFNKSSKQ